jgi:phosphate transport system substrate-binding protein
VNVSEVGAGGVPRGHLASSVATVTTVRRAPNADRRFAYADIENRSGNFVTPTRESVTAAAAAAAAKMPEDFRVSITDAASPDAYPIASFTWLLIPSRIADADKGKSIIDFLGWMLAEGQTYTKPLGYAPLPDAVVEMEKKAIGKVQAGAP